MEIHQLRYFCAVVKTRNFTAAARQEHVSQPSLSKQILKLENELGTKLFDRLGPNIRLSATGSIFLPQAQAVLALLDEVKGEIHEKSLSERGTIMLGVTGTISPYFLPEKLVGFARQYPLIQVRVTEEPSSTLLEHLRAGVVDACIVAAPVTTHDLVSVELAREPLYAVVPADHQLSREKRISIGDLGGEPFLYLKDFEFGPNTAAAFRRAKFSPNVVYESACFLTIVAMVCGGIGVSLVPEHAAQDQKGCSFIPIKDPQAARTLCFVESKQRYIARAQRLFADFLFRHGKNRAQKNPPAGGLS
jgi:LysR family hydrogen peroxide-inducible transcriptional activator